MLRAFIVRAVRADIRLSSIPGLVQEGPWIKVRDVPDATPCDLDLLLDLLVGFQPTLQEADLDLIASLGGTVQYHYGSILTLSALLPDPMVPLLQGRPDVRYVEVNGVACIGRSDRASLPGPLSGGPIDPELG